MGDAMRLRAATVTLLLLTAAAHAAPQREGMWRQEKYCPPGRSVPYCDPERIQKQRQIDEAYRDAIQHYPVPAPVASDPWGGVRAGEATSVNKKKKKR
jgi:hypothetical protein